MSKPVTFLLEMPNELRFSLEPRKPVEFNIGSHAVVQTPAAYDGPTIVTPKTTQQVLHTKDLRMEYDVVVKSIPSNYGLITWNGSVLTVS